MNIMFDGFLGVVGDGSFFIILFDDVFDLNEGGVFIDINLDFGDGK